MTTQSSTEKGGTCVSKHSTHSFDARTAAMIAHPAGKGIPASDEVWDRETDEALALLVKHTPELEPVPAVELVPMRRVLGEGFVLALLILVMCFAEPILGGLA